MPDWHQVESFKREFFSTSTDEPAPPSRFTHVFHIRPTARASLSRSTDACIDLGKPLVLTFLGILACIRAVFDPPNHPMREDDDSQLNEKVLGRSIMLVMHC